MNKREEDIVAKLSVLSFLIELDAEQLKSYVNGAGSIVICNEVQGKDNNLEENYVYWLDETVGEI